MNNCPSCNTSLIGAPIPEDIREHYSGTHWRREIGIEVQGFYDGVSYWRCPDCLHTWKAMPWVPDWEEKFLND